MTIPILIDGKRQGSIETRRDGAYTRFEARCAFVPGVRRLWVYGGGGRGCLGVMQPAGGELRLTRKLSRAGMRGFPEPVEYAGFEERKKERSAPPREKTACDAETGERFLVTEDGARCLALPCELRRAPPGVRVRVIGGRQYLLFRC